ncbi:hypothetical protein ORJ66_07305 [Pseudoalteromonas tunicata]|uniref:hypothetical protein n=1 Tax=Pseudoalteromonas tunicata TaxID=314281 RepID=UPI00273E1A95|nr:hypothetical protein [Pseudoalteromonas tunicata]MDP5212849.1 hypothetical protein [Pseudoalteromonas tunicata]
MGDPFDFNEILMSVSYFSSITTKALTQFINDSINQRLKSAIDENSSGVTVNRLHEQLEDETESEKPKIVTTEEEITGFNIVKAILCQKVEIDRIIARDTQSYFGILLDDNNRKPICRLHFNAKQKYIGFLNEERKEERFAIESISDIYKFTDKLLDSITLYE